MNGLNVLVLPELRNSETRERSESCAEDLGTLAEATRSRRRTTCACAWTMYGLNGLNVLVSPELGNSETRKRSESCLEDLGTLAEAPGSCRRTA